MSRKIKGFTVALDQNVSEEYAQRVKEAIEMMAHVIKVEEVEEDHTSFIERSRVKHEVMEEIRKLHEKVSKI